MRKFTLILGLVWAPFTFGQTIYSGTVGTYRVIMSLSLKGERATGSYNYTKRAGQPGPSLLLSGVKKEGEWSLEETDGKRRTGSWIGSISDGTFKGQWKSGEKVLPFELKELEQSEDEWLKMMADNYSGVIGNRYRISFRVNKRAEPKLLEGVYAYHGRSGLLRWVGKISSKKGDVELREFAGEKLTGIFFGQISPKRIDGRWQDGAGTKDMPFSLVESADLLSARSPQELRFLKKQVTSVARNCNSESEYAVLEGWKIKSAQDSINKVLKSLGTAKSCVAPAKGDNTQYQYSASTSLKALFGFRYLHATAFVWSFTGGAHGNGATTSLLFDANTGEKVNLAVFLKPTAADFIRERIVATVYNGDEASSRFFLDHYRVDEREIFPNGEGLEFCFAPYVVASYADAEPCISITKEEWPKLFEVNGVTKAVFGTN